MLYLDEDSSGAPVSKVRCPQCRSLLAVQETPSGARAVSIAVLGASVERSAHALEAFQAPGEGPDIVCPACSRKFDPSEPGRDIRPRQRS